MDKSSPRDRPGSVQPRNVTIKDLAAELGLSITTISRALNGYSDVGEKTRRRIGEAARRLGYTPNRNAQRLVNRRTHNIAWVQSDNDRKFVDPHFVEVMAGVLRGARERGYDVVLTSHTPERELAVYERCVNDNSVDGFILDLPREDDARIALLLEVGRPFVVHGRDSRSDGYGWVDVDNYGNFYRLTRLLIANGHRRIAFINGDARYTYALYRERGVRAAVRDAGLPTDALAVYNGVHPMGGSGLRLTTQALDDADVTALLYSSTIMAVEGPRAVAGSGREIAIATMDDQLHYIDLSSYLDQFTFVRSSLRDAGRSLIANLIAQCEGQGEPRGTYIPSSFHLAPRVDASSLELPVPDPE